MSGAFGLRKDSQSTKFKQRLRILVKKNLKELCDLKLSVLGTFDNAAISLCCKRAKSER